MLDYYNRNDIAVGGHELLLIALTRDYHTGRIDGVYILVLCVQGYFQYEKTLFRGKPLHATMVPMDKPTELDVRATSLTRSLNVFVYLKLPLKFIQRLKR